MKKTNSFGILTFAILLILAVMGFAAWNYFLGDGSLPSMNFMFFSLILFGVILLLVILNLDKIVKLSNPELKEENTPSPIEENKTIEEIVPNALAEEEVKEVIVPTPKAAEKPKVEVKKAPVEKPASSSTSKPYGHTGTRRSGVWIDEK